MSEQPEDTAVDDDSIIELLRTPGLSIKYLDEETKEWIRGFIRRNHIEKGMSLSDMAKLIGNKTSGYTSWLARQVGIRPRDFEEARLAGIHKKVRKYERRPFNGTNQDKAYLLGLKHGDFSACTPFGDVTRVSTSTTHPALINLFTDLFSPYGHVYKNPRYKKDTKTYEWNLQAILDKSFAFLIDARDVCRKWVMDEESTMLAYLAGLVDAEGNIRVYPNHGKTTLLWVAIHNTDLDLIEFAYQCLAKLGCKPLKPYLDKEPGYVSKGFHIVMRKAYWRVLVSRFDEAQSLLQRLPLRHEEKVQTKQLMLSVTKGELWGKVEDAAASLRKSFDEQVSQCTSQAETDFLAHH
ncbi:MAG: LAGLIDADG family homing endonuclease [Thaumarchaeota archaeon]|nr:LAGLIDADG family homing endonuclease [Nitrososphaerota archaeon]